MPEICVIAPVARIASIAMRRIRPAFHQCEGWLGENVSFKDPKAAHRLRRTFFETESTWRCVSDRASRH